MRLVLRSTQQRTRMTVTAMRAGVAERVSEDCGSPVRLASWSSSASDGALAPTLPSPFNLNLTREQSSESASSGPRTARSPVSGDEDEDIGAAPFLAKVVRPGRDLAAKGVKRVSSFSKLSAAARANGDAHGFTSSSRPLNALWPGSSGGRGLSFEDCELVQAAKTGSERGNSTLNALWDNSTPLTYEKCELLAALDKL